MLRTVETIDAATLPVSVAIHASDPISQTGVTTQLREYPELLRLDETHQENGQVALLLADAVDASLPLRVRKLARAGNSRVVLVVDQIREAELMELVTCGVSAILWRREATGNRLLRAILAAGRGEGYLPADLLGRLLTQVGRLQSSQEGPAGVAPTAGMAPREVDVVRLLAEGKDTQEIAVRLAYSERTVKNVLHNLMNRFQLHNRAHAVAYAMREGYI
ncbi:response regulator transcription factor [Kitasatospora sp. NPDC008050]|uniref:helix-turn-helix transcriptional regulator n=1 Tax=Kitasatospora sp. NPDC008050 TaxID=3364021 RepID=UPI0036E93547